MVNEKTAFFSYTNNFHQYDSIKSECIKGNISMLDNVKITIAIPTYNRPFLLKETLNSALFQKGYTDYCIIVVDNNPQRKDATELLLEKYNDERLLYFKNNENIGMFGNQNRCFEIAKSEWVVLLHDDDLLYSDYLSICSSYLTKISGIDALQTKKKYWYSDIDPYPQNKNVELDSLKCIYDISNYLHFISGAQTGGCFRRQAFIETGGYNPLFYPTSDFVFALQFEQRFKLFMLNQILVVYRILDNASLKEETLDLFLKNDFYLKLALMRKYGVPRSIALGITSKMMEKQAVYLRTNFNSTYTPVLEKVVPIYKKNWILLYYFERIILLIWEKIVVFFFKRK